MASDGSKSGAAAQKLMVPSIPLVASYLACMPETGCPCLQIFVMSSHRIQQRGYDTLFKYTTANPKSAISIFVKKFPAKLQVGLHVSVQVKQLGCLSVRRKSWGCLRCVMAVQHLPGILWSLAVDKGVASGSKDAGWAEDLGVRRSPQQ